MSNRVRTCHRCGGPNSAYGHRLCIGCENQADALIWFVILFRYVCGLTDMQPTTWEKMWFISQEAR